MFTAGYWPHSWRWGSCGPQAHISYLTWRHLTLTSNFLIINKQEGSTEYPLKAPPTLPFSDVRWPFSQRASHDHASEGTFTSDPCVGFFIVDFLVSFCRDCVVSAWHCLSKDKLTKAIFQFESRDTIFQAWYLWFSLKLRSVIVLSKVYA